MAAGGHAKCMAQNTKLNVVVVEQSNTHTVIIMHNIDEKDHVLHKMHNS